MLKPCQSKGKPPLLLCLHPLKQSSHHLAIESNQLDQAQFALGKSMLAVSNHLLFFTCLIMASGRICPLIVTWFEAWLTILELPGSALPFSRMSMTFTFFQSPGTLPDCHDLAILGVETGGSTSHSYLCPLRSGAFCSPFERLILRKILMQQILMQSSFLPKTSGCPSFFLTSSTLPWSLYCYKD